MVNKFQKLTAKGSIWLMIFRGPRIIINRIRVKINTFYWTCFLGKAGKNIKIDLGVIIDIPKNVFIEDNVSIGKKVLIGAENNNGKLFLGENVQINRGCVIDHSGDLHIGKDTLISAESTIFSHTHGYDPRSKSKPINKKIGENSWIGYRSTIGENANVIVDNVIIAAGSVVVKPCTELDGIYGGSPAKLIKRKN